MPKLIDAEKLKDWLDDELKTEPIHYDTEIRRIKHYIDTLPDAGCAEVERLRKENEKLRDELDGWELSSRGFP